MSVYRAYAKALYETLKPKTDEAGLRLVETQLDEFAQMQETVKAARVVLQGPAASRPEKKQAIAAISKKYGFSQDLERFLNLLIQKRRMSALPGIKEAFQEVRVEMKGGVLGLIQTPDPIAEKEIQELEQAFGKKLGKPVEFRIRLEPALLAGIKVTIQGTTYDGTVRTQLNRIRDQFMYGELN